MTQTNPHNTPTMPLAQLLAAIDVSYLGQQPVAGLCQDSRQLVAGEVFVARDGLNHRAVDFIQPAAEAGAVAVLVDAAELDEQQADSSSLPVIRIADLAYKLGALCRELYTPELDKLCLVGITGTNGKTSCANYLAQALEAQGQCCYVLGTVGNGRLGQLASATHTTPDAISLHKLLGEYQRQGATAVVMEVSSHALEQGRVHSVPFNAVAFSNLSRDHLDYHGSMAEYGAAKARLFNQFDAAVQAVNIDDQFGAQLSTSLSEHRRVSFGSSEGADLQLQQLQLGQQGMTLQLSWQGESCEVVSGLIGRFNADNLLLVAAVMLGLNYSLQAVAQSLAELVPVSGRMQRIAANGCAQVVVDYAHTPDALEKALEASRHHCAGKLYAVFGCGGDRDTGKRAEMAQVAERFADQVLVTSDNPRTEDPQTIVDMVCQGLSAPELALVEVDRRAAIALAIATAGPDDLVLIAGKGHEDYQEIHGVRHPFSDAQVARELLATKELELA